VGGQEGPKRKKGHPQQPKASTKQGRKADAGKKSSEKRAAKTKDAADKEATTAKPKDVCFQFCDGVVLMS